MQKEMADVPLDVTAQVINGLVQKVSVGVGVSPGTRRRLL